MWIFRLLLLASLPLFAGCKVTHQKKYQVPDSLEMRTYEDVILDCGKYGDANFTISLPEKIPEGGLPCIVIVGGLQTGRESLQFIPDHGEYALVSYEYSETIKDLHRAKIWHLFAARNAMLEVCPELIGIFKYLEKQPWWNKEPISLMGYSFGTTFIPVTYVKAEEEGIKLGPGVMAYGGAGVYCLFKANAPFPDFLKGITATFVAAGLKSMDPIIYAPQMKGEFLIINGTNDSQIPMECAERLQNLVPEPKTIMNLETGHMHPDNTELTLRLIKISRGWVKEKQKGG